MINIGDLLAILRLQDELSPAIETAKKNLGLFDNAVNTSAYQLTLLGRGAKEAGVLITAAITVPLVGAATAAIKFGSDFESTTE